MILVKRRLGKRYKTDQSFTPPPGWDSGFEFSGREFGDAHDVNHSAFFEALFGRQAGRTWPARRATPGWGRPRQGAPGRGEGPSRACRADSEQLMALVDEGVLTPSGGEPQDWRFGGTALQRARAALRLTHDLELSAAGAALVLERDAAQGVAWSAPGVRAVVNELARGLIKRQAVRPGSRYGGRSERLPAKR